MNKCNDLAESMQSISPDATLETITATATNIISAIFNIASVGSYFHAIVLDTKVFN